MIRYEWRTDLSESERESVRTLLEVAADYDREPEFSRIDYADVVRDLEDDEPAGQLLLIWMLPRQNKLGEDVPEAIAGVLRLVLDRDSVGDISLVIAPEFRSLGIVTLFVERAGLDVSANGGWLGSGATGLQSWAQGNHPAAGRLSNRHLIPRTKRIWKLVRPVGQPWDEPGSDVRVRLEDNSSPTAELADFAAGSKSGTDGTARLLPAIGNPRKSVVVAADPDARVVGALVLDRDPLVVAEYGKCGVIEYVSPAYPGGDPMVTRMLLTAAFEQAVTAGLDGVVVYVDSDDAELVAACRRTRFHHDRTDVRFEL